MVRKEASLVEFKPAEKSGIKIEKTLFYDYQDQFKTEIINELNEKPSKVWMDLNIKRFMDLRSKCVHYNTITTITGNTDTITTITGNITTGNIDSSNTSTGTTGTITTGNIDIDTITTGNIDSSNTITIITGNSNSSNSSTSNKSNTRNVKVGIEFYKDLIKNHYILKPNLYQISSLSKHQTLNLLKSFTNKSHDKITLQWIYGLLVKCDLLLEANELYLLRVLVKECRKNRNENNHELFVGYTLIIGIISIVFGQKDLGDEYH
jgi:hypothetical protein